MEQRRKFSASYKKGREPEDDFVIHVSGGLPDGYRTANERTPVSSNAVVDVVAVCGPENDTEDTKNI